MSSWANIRVPRKRDLSQIPAELRPSIVSRAERVEVRLSESFQPSPFSDSFQNSIVEPWEGGNRTSKSTSKMEDAVSPLRGKEYVSKKIELVPSPGAFELKFQNKTYVFVILRHIRTPQNNDLWISSYNSIRKYYTNKIIIIDDNSTINTVNGRLYNAEIIQSEFPGAGEILPYYYFLQNHWADTMVFLHDSMFLHRPFRDQELDHTVRFHWYFTRNGFDDPRKIQSCLSLLQHNKEVTDFYKDPANQWKGCSGGATIIDFDTVFALETKYKAFTVLTMAMKTRKDRETFERVLGILLYVEGMLTDSTCSNFGDIIRYPNAFESESNNAETASHLVKQRGYDTAVLKVWRGR